ncbi:MAG: dTDP-4-dehydrorhamnose reductase [Acidobacteria bacterium]|nr:dTDP-4-dehydrorhamnose reductase [Acidobacteriota bacterium]
MKIAITGAGGFVGKELARQFAADHQLISLTHSMLDITNREAVNRVIRETQPDLVINCAVLGVDICEADPALAEAINVAGPKFLAEVVAELGAEIMHLSTNYVFRGDRQLGAVYTIDDEALPINIYGKTKLAGEQAVIAAALNSYIVRTSWVYGTGKENFFSQAAQSLAAKKPVRAVNDLWASVTYVADLVARIKEILAHRQPGIYQVVNDGVCSHYEFAVELARRLQFDGEALVEGVSETTANRLAHRPHNTPMRCLLSEELGLAPMRPWQTTLPDFFSQLGL